MPNDFAIYTFRVVMLSIQVGSLNAIGDGISCRTEVYSTKLPIGLNECPQVKYLYAVVEILMSKLNKSSHLNALVRTSMADVLSKILTIATVDSLGK